MAAITMRLRLHSIFIECREAWQKLVESIPDIDPCVSEMAGETREVTPDLIDI